MRKSVQYQLSDPNEFQSRLLEWSKSKFPFCLLNNNDFKLQNKALPAEHAKIEFDLLAGVMSLHELVLSGEENAFDALQRMCKTHNDWLLGYLTYDLKNHNENLISSNFNALGFPLLHFFVPRYLLMLKKNVLSIQYQEAYDSLASVAELFDSIMNSKRNGSAISSNVEVKPRIGRDEYIEKVGRLKKHIQRGDIYEVNFCQEFYASGASIDPVVLYGALNTMSPAPFSAFYAHDKKFLMCASPERYLKKSGNMIFSQPIKGTARRGQTEAEDAILKEALLHDPKERSENIMIVDLVRNDLSRSARKGTVNVEELLGVYSFPQVHQLISTISAELAPDLHFVEVIRNSFPMGSMTGAPKVRAMELIEEFEESRRGLFSGAVGYISPEADFDFNVVIRSMLYNESARYLSFTVGGAITNLSDPESEYEECLLKAGAMLNVLKSRQKNPLNRPYAS